MPFLYLIHIVYLSSLNGKVSYKDKRRIKASLQIAEVRGLRRQIWPEVKRAGSVCPDILPFHTPDRITSSDVQLLPKNTFLIITNITQFCFFYIDVAI
jgi:hypothetical protein